ncbi:MAG: hypothetical protein KF700_01295 [Hyphomonadaceae bacterium]|nr:hypothetical protein [Hyphomonadaceae bacterium]
MKTVTTSLKGLSFAAALAFAGAAAAQESSSSVAPAEAAFAADVEVLSQEDLQALAGGTGITTAVITEQTLSAFNGGNTVRGEVVGSGQINIGANAFSGYSGVGNFVLNTGHNNNLQSSMNVSILLAPPGS